VTTHRYLAFDLGAKSGPAFLGTLDGEPLAMEELYRFSNGPETTSGTLYWNILSIYHHVLKGMRAYCRLLEFPTDRCTSLLCKKVSLC
jgi:hypothetical protein